MNVTGEQQGGSEIRGLFFLSLVFVLAATAPVTRADLGGETFTNLTQVTSFMSEPGLRYPLVTLWEPAMFEPLAVWWTDFTQLKELAAIRDYPSHTLSGITVWPLQITEYPTGETVFKHPWLDAEILRLQAPEGDETAKRYDENLRLWCLLHGMNPVPYDELIAGPYAFLDPKQIVLRVWLADVNDWEAYEKNVAAEQDEIAKAEAMAAEMQAEMVALSEGGGGMMMLMGGDPCVLTNETDGFSIVSITADTNQWMTITWESCTNFVYGVFTAEEMSFTNVWTAQHWLFGEVGTTSSTDTNAAAFPARFYRVVRANPNTLNNGIPYGWAVSYGLNPLDPNLAFADPDGDCFTNFEEYRNGTDPTAVDPLMIISASTLYAGSATNMASAPASLATLHGFSSGVTLGVIEGSDGNFYGINDDALFKMSSDGGTVTTLFQFYDDGPGITNGYYARLPIQGSDGNLYGVTWLGGNTNDTNYCLNGWYGYGTVYRITTNGTFTTLHVFGGMELNQYGGTPEGALPTGQLVEGQDGNFYGVTEAGGVPDCADSWCCSSGFGVVFRVTPQGGLTNLYNFTGGADGADPRAGLVQGTDGYLYGTTSAGTGNAGTVFRISTNGVSFTTLHQFTGGTDGATPLAALVQDGNGDLYGTTYGGGAHGFGTVFTITTNGTLTTLHSFAGGLEGAYPSTSLVQDGDGDFYGTTVMGGLGYGTIFRITPQGTLTTHYQFGGADGTYPDRGALVPGSEGSWYGTTLFGGSGGGGTVYEFLPSTYDWSISGSTITDGQGSPTIRFTVGSTCSMTVNVTMTNVFGCVRSSSANATVVVPAPTANSPVTAGETLSLSAPTVAGATYSWTGPDGFSSTNQNPSVANVLPCASGQYCVNVIASGCTWTQNCVSATVVAPTPTGDSPRCAGEMLNLSVTNVAGATYNWTGPNGFSSTSQNPSIPEATTNATGTYCVTVAAGGCASVSNCVSATVNPWPTATVSGTTTTGPQCPVLIKAELTGMAPWTVTWSDGTIQDGLWDNPSTREVNPQTNFTYTVTAFSDANCSGGSASGSATVTISTNTTSSVIVSNEVLIVYNSNLTNSLSCKDYYINNRPGFSNANVLACSCTTDGVDGFESITSVNLTNQILNPIINFIQSNPTKSIHYVVLMYGMPSRVNDGYSGCSPYPPSVQHHISRCMSDGCNPTGPSYEGATCPFVAANYPGTTFLVTALNLETLADCEAYIYKVASMYTGDVIISARAAGYTNLNYYVDDTRTSQYQNLHPGADAQSAIKAENPSASVFYTSNTVISAGTNVTGYVGWGTHNGVFSNTYPTDQSIKWSGSSAWWIIQTIESFNGIRDSHQGSVERWFAPDAWGGTNYANTPVGAVSHVEEPGFALNGPTYMSLWEAGFLFSECAWASRNTALSSKSFQAVGDPLIKQ